MTISSAASPTRTRGHRLATAASALAAAAALAGATAGVAAAEAPHSGAGTTYRVLSVLETHTNTPAPSRTWELQYTGPHSRYLLRDQYAGQRRTLSDISWQRDALRPRHRLVDRVVVDPAKKTWLEQKTTVPPLPRTPFGITSSAGEVKRAIADGRAHPFGQGRKDGQRVHLLLLAPTSRHVRSDDLWINASTDQPVAETKAFDVGGRIRILHSHWEDVSRRALNRLEAKPTIPAGYTVTRD